MSKPNTKRKSGISQSERNPSKMPKQDQLKMNLERRLYHLEAIKRTKKQVDDDSLLATWDTYEIEEELSSLKANWEKFEIKKKKHSDPLR